MTGSRSELRFIPVIVLTIACAAFFYNSLTYDFLWDDTTLIAESRYIRDIGKIPLFFSPGFWNHLHPHPGQYRPVRTTSLAIDYYFWKLNPVGYHLTNLLLHIAGVLLVYLFVMQYVGKESVVPGRNDTLLRRLFWNSAFLTAFFFAAHPIHTETILFIKNRSDLLSFVFFMSSLLLFLYSLSKQNKTCLRRLSLIGAWLIFIPAVLSKEMALVLPGVLLLYSYCFIAEPEDRKSVLWRLSPFVLLIIVYFLFRMTFITPFRLVNAEYPLPANISEHVLVVVKTIGAYVMMLVAPLRLSPDRPFSIPTSVFEPTILLSLTGLAVLVFFWLISKRLSPIWFFSIGLIILTMLPVANIIFLSSRPLAEQRLYFPSFGFCLFMGSALIKLSGTENGWRKITRSVATIILTAVILAIYTDITVERNRDWRDAITFYSNALTTNPDSARMHNNFGKALASSGCYKEAINHYRTALRLDPKNPAINNNMGLALFHLGQAEEALRYYEAAIHIQPDYAMPYYNIGLLWSRKGNEAQAIWCFRKAISLCPEYSEAHNTLGLLLARRGQYGDALQHYRKSLDLEPENAETLNNLGQALGALGRTDDAIGYFRKALLIDPDYQMAHFNLGVALDISGQTGEAIEQYQTALRLGPDHVKTLNNLGSLLTQAGMYEDAIRLFSRAIRLEPDYAKALNNMGLALVKTGHSVDAIDFFWRALQSEPDNEATCANLRMALINTGHAEALLDKYIADPNKSPSLAGVLSCIAETFIALNRNDMARQYVDKALQINPMDDHARRLSLSLRQKENHVKARSFH
jgi:tetratricopeptide (TPR) repeat protein